MEYVINFGSVKPGSLIVDLETAKANAKIEFTDEDTLLQLFVDAAAAEIESYIGAPVLERENVEILVDGWPVNFVLPIDVNSITSISYVDEDAAEQTLANTAYTLFGNIVRFKDSMPAKFVGPIKIIATAGYTNTNMPKDIQRAALLIFGAADTYRENMPVKLETSAKALLRPYKIY